MPWWVFTLACFLGPTCVAAQGNIDPDYLQSWQMVGQGRPAEAIPMLRSYISTHPDFAPGYRTLARAYEMTRREEEGIAYFRSLLGRNPRAGLGHYGLALMFHGLRDEHGREEVLNCLRERQIPYDLFSLQGFDPGRSALGKAAIDRFKRAIGFDERSAESELSLGGYLSRCNRPAEAEAAVERAVALAGLRSDPELRASALQILAPIEMSLDWRSSKAVSDIQESCDLSKEGRDPDAIFTRCALWAGALAKQGRRTEFDQLGGDLLSLARELKSPVAEQWVELQLGVALREDVDPESALPHFERALDLAQQLKGARLPLNNLLKLIAQTKSDLGDYEGAFLMFERALEAAKAEGGDAADILSKLTVAYNRSGKNLEAIRAAEESNRLFRTSGRQWQAGAELGDIAEAYQSLGDAETATRYIRQSLGSAARFHDTHEEIRLGDELAQTLLDYGHAAEALDQLRRVAGLLSSVRDLRFEITTRALLGEAYSRLGERAAADREFEAGMAVTETYHDAWLQSSLLLRIGQHQARAGDLTRAKKTFEKCLQVAEAADLLLPAQESRRGLANIYLSRNEPGKALDQLKKAIEGLESMRAEAPGPDLRSGLVERNWSLYEDILKVLGKLDLENPHQGYDREALDYAERGRARVLMDLLVESQAAVTIGLTSEQARHQAKLDRQLSAAYAALRVENSPTNRAAAAAAEDAEKEWGVQLRLVNPKYQELKYPEPLDAEGIRRIAARTNTTILEYSLGADSSFLWIITAKGIRMAPLPPQAKISSMVRQLRDAVTKRPAARTANDYQAPSRELYEILIAPASREVEGTRLVIVPDGILHYLPFECLTAPDGQFLIERLPVTYAPSVSVFAHLMESGGSKAHRDLLAVGVSAFATGSDRDATGISGDGPRARNETSLVRSVYLSAGMDLGTLPGAVKEVRGIAALFPRKDERILVGADATLNELKSEPLDEFRFVHIATHALIDERSPARSGVLLWAGKEGGGAHGAASGIAVLRFADIVRLKFDADLITLSACQTGLGTIVRGEGVVGLVRAFLFAGARRLAVSLWPVNDESTADFMTAFYRHIRAGAAPSESLRDAKLEMIRSSVEAYRHPYFWAPFVLIGAQ